MGASMPDISPHHGVNGARGTDPPGDIYQAQSQTSSATDSTEANSVILNHRNHSIG